MAAGEAKVLATFVGAVDGRPDLRSRQPPQARQIVLKWLAEQFEHERRYREAEVNELLLTRHWDCATLRRELIGYGMMERESGVYWRCPEAEWRTAPGGERGADPSPKRPGSGALPATQLAGRRPPPQPPPPQVGGAL